MTQALLLVLLLGAQTPAAAVPPPAAPPAAPRPPTDWPFRLITPDDYPAGALRGEQEGRVGYHLDIGADGRVTQCRVTRTSGSAALDVRTCQLARIRARFTPARDSTGNAVPDTRDGEVTWRLGRAEEAPE